MLRPDQPDKLVVDRQIAHAVRDEVRAGLQHGLRIL